MSLKLPDGRIVNNLPEQVAKNADDIKKIADFLDGINIQDNVVAIADISQILTRDELDIVERPVAFIYYSDQLYIKKNEVGGSAFFDVIFSITGSTVLSFNSKEIEVVLSTGALSLTTSTVSTYSKSEIDTLLSAKANITYVDTQLATKANLSGANFTGGITAPSIVESMSGYSYNTTDTPADMTLTPIYVGMCKNGNKLTIVWFGTINKGSSASDVAFLGRFLIPDEVLSKIYPYNLAGYDVVANGYVELFTNLSTSIKLPINMNKYTGRIQPVLRGITDLTANTDYLLRYEVTFLLSDNLAA